MRNAPLSVGWQGLRTCIAASLAGLAACGTPESAPMLTGTSWAFDTHATKLGAASCPGGAGGQPGEGLNLAVTGVALDGIEPSEDLPGAVFAGGWHLASDDPAFGGLSGLVAAPDGNLLAVSDQGAFVWIELAGDRPAGARIAAMRDAAGDVIDGKALSDAEGLDLRDGIALVSFEREHRVLAFDLAVCGSAARGVEVAQLGQRIAGMSGNLDENGGAEGLALTATGELLLAIETRDTGLPIARVDASGAARAAARIPPRGAPVLTGIDRTGDTLYAVLRSYVPAVGNTIEVIAFPVPGQESNLLPVRRIIRLQPRHGTDNFEGVALQRRTDGGLRLWLVSDDNFSRRQRTLLYAFDLPPG